MDKKINVFFTADTHFGSQRTFELSRRPFSSVKDMDEEMIKNWNNQVSDDDIIIHIGDFGDYEVIKKLKGNIYLICGNYEEADLEKKFLSNETAFLNHLYSLGFKSVKFGTSEYKNPEKNIDVMLNHEPNIERVKFLLFGHIHGLQKVKKNGLNVSMDANFYKLVTEEDVLFYKNAIDNFYDEEVFCQ